MKLTQLRPAFICAAWSFLWSLPVEARFLQVDPVGYKDQTNLYAYVGNDPLNHADPSGMTCAPVGLQSGGATKWDCRIDAVLARDANGNETLRPPNAAENERFAPFNRRYTAATNTLARHPTRSGRVPDLQGSDGGFPITAGEARDSLVSRQFVQLAESPNSTGAALVSEGVYNEASGRVEGAVTYVTNTGVSRATQIDIVHDGGMHATRQEWTGRLQANHALRGIDHQGPYNGVACHLLGEDNC